MRKVKCLILMMIIIPASLLVSCMGRSPVPELEMVPGTALLHVHLEEGLNTRLRELAGDYFYGFPLADSLLKSGPMGIALVGVDITSLEPQMLLLSEHVSVEYAAALTARQLDLDPRQEDNRIDLVSQQGYARAAVASRNGWTAIYIGPAPHITIGSWLELSKDNSLAADEALVSVLDENAQLTVLFPGNLFGFLSLLPLERQISWWQDYKNTTAAIRPAALALGLSWPDPPENTITVSLRLARREGGMVSVVIEAEDSGIDADSAFASILRLTEGMN